VYFCGRVVELLGSDTKSLKLVRFQVLMVMSMQMAVFWDVAPCNVVDVDQHFREAYCPDGWGSKLL
jgi:hypothetical protein